MYYSILMRVFEAIAVTSYAVAGALAGSNEGCDIVGMTVFGTVTALGGGTMRDLIIHLPVFWAENSYYLYLTLGFTVLAYVYLVFWEIERFPRFYLLMLEAIGLGSFAVIGSSKCFDQGLPAITCIYLGVLTGTGGGAIRDTMSGHIPGIFKEDLICISSLTGSFLFIMIRTFVSLSDAWLTALSVFVILLIASMRIIGFVYRDKLPRPRHQIQTFIKGMKGKFRREKNTETTSDNESPVVVVPTALAAESSVVFEPSGKKDFPSNVERPSIYNIDHPHALPFLGETDTLDLIEELERNPRAGSMSSAISLKSFAPSLISYASIERCIAFRGIKETRRRFSQPYEHPAHPQRNRSHFSESHVSEASEAIRAPQNRASQIDVVDIVDLDEP